MACPSNPIPPPAERSRNWLELPAELTSSILIRLGAVEVLMSARKVCKTWREICSDPEMWRVVVIKHSDYEKSPKIFKHVVTKAVELSCGQLVDLDLQIKGHPQNLLRYVFDRSSQLRRLCLFSSHKIMSEWLSEMLERLPLLEELHLDCNFHFNKAVEIAARCCPQLKSLKLINTLNRRPKMGCDEDALAIAGHMTGLCHLELYGPNKMTSDGLLAILENCPHLESLDVSHGVVNVGPDLERRLSQQIKDLKLSYDSMGDSDAELMGDSDSDSEFMGDSDSDLYTGGETDDLDSSDEDEKIENNDNKGIDVSKACCIRIEQRLARLESIVFQQNTSSDTAGIERPARIEQRLARLESIVFQQNTSSDTAGIERPASTVSDDYDDKEEDDHSDRDSD